MTYMVREAQAAVSSEVNSSNAATNPPATSTGFNTISTAVSPSSTSMPPPPLTYMQPTTQIPLTTTFTPPSFCTESRISMFEGWNYQMWLNEPHPYSNQPATACYPPEFMKSYRRVSSGTLGSSIVPAMAGLVCPDNYCTAFVASWAEDRNYVACCPRGFQLARASTTSDTNRPVYGGTCYSDVTSGSTYTVTMYDAKGFTASQMFSASVSGDQVYAHVIDGFIGTTSATIGCPKPSASLLSAPQPSASRAPSFTPTPTPMLKPKIGGATIAGIIIGAVCALVSIVTLVWLLLRWRKTGQSYSSYPPPKIDQVDHDKAREIFEKDSSAAAIEIGVCNEKKGMRFSWINGGWGPFEMSAEQVHEMEAATREDKKRIPSGLVSSAVDAR